MEWLENFINSVPAWLNAIALIISGFAAISALTPTTKDDTVIAKVIFYFKKIADVFGLNVLNAKNKE